MNSPVQSVINEFKEKYGEFAPKLIETLLNYINNGWNLTKAVNQALIDVGLNDFLTENIEMAIEKSASIGAGVKSISLLKSLESEWDGSGMKLSEKLHGTQKQMRHNIISTVQAQIALNKHANQTAMKLYDGYNTSDNIIRKQELPKYINDLATFARRSDLPGLSKLCRQTRRKVNRLAQNGAPTKALKVAYSQLIDAVEKHSEKALENAVKVAVEEKSRYTAERIARTESARAWLDGYLRKYEDNERVAAHKWKLASRHPVFDICDMYAKADMYGLGKGIFPKDKIPNLPVHPHCLCYLSPVYKSELKDKKQKENIQEAGDRWLKTLPKQEQYKVLGLDGLKAWKNGADWRNYARNYSTDYAKTRLKDLNIKTENDIIKIDSNWENIQEWEITNKGRIVPTKIIDKKEHYRTLVQGNSNDVIQYFTGRNSDINYDLYNNSGQLIGQINWTNHNNPKQHPFGKKGEHKHIIKWINNKMQRGKAEKLSKNDYILFGGEENDN